MLFVGVVFVGVQCCRFCCSRVCCSRPLLLAGLAILSLQRQEQQLSCITCVHLPKPRQDQLGRKEMRGGRVVEVVFVAVVCVANR